MATTKNKNLFYQLYSKDNSVAQSGYACTSSIDESDTSFDISGSQAQITDSNGNILASVDLSSIHAAGITQYNVETKILQPKSAYLLLGNEYGETYKSQFFIISKVLTSIEYYYDFCNIQFDIVYRQNGKKHDIHVDSSKIRECSGSFVNLAQNQLNMLKVPISISIKSYDDVHASKLKYDYINFQSTEEGYDFIIRNVKLIPIQIDDENCNGEIGEFLDTPFISPELTADVVIDILTKYKPNLVENTNNKDAYNISCKLYRQLMQLGNEITSDFNTFVYELDIIKKYFLPCFETDGKLIFVKKFKDILCVKYPEIYKKYFTGSITLYNIYDIVKILNEFKDYVFNRKNAMGASNCYEDINRRINNIKYPNGALRGIVIIPEWPKKEEYQTSVLWLNHIADRVEICIPVNVDALNKYYGGNVISQKKAILFEKTLASVKVNALIPTEKQEYIEDEENLPLNDITSNEGFTNSFDDLYETGFDNDEHISDLFHRVPLELNKSLWDEPIQYHHPELYVDDNHDDSDIWEDNPNKTNVQFVDSNENMKEYVIGLYKYMKYLSANDLWLRIGDGYMIIGKDDDMLVKTKNLLQSVLIYNPNDIPIKVRYMIFS